MAVLSGICGGIIFYLSPWPGGVKSLSPYQCTSSQSCHHWSYGVMLLLSLSFTSIILVVAGRSLVILSPVPKNGAQYYTHTLLLHMNFALSLATLASIDIVLGSFHIQVICGILYHVLFFPPLTIFLPLNVGFIGTLEALTRFFIQSFFNIYFIDVFVHFDYAIGPCLVS